MDASAPVGHPTSPGTAECACHTRPKPRIGSVAQEDATVAVAGAGDLTAAARAATVADGCESGAVVAVGADVAVATGVGSAVGVAGLAVGAAVVAAVAMFVADVLMEAEPVAVPVVAVTDGVPAPCELHAASKQTIATNPTIVD